MVAMFWLQKQQHKNILELIQIQFKWTTQCNQYFSFVHKVCLKVERQCGKNTPQSARALIILWNVYHTKVKCKMQTITNCWLLLLLVKLFVTLISENSGLFKKGHTYHPSPLPLRKKATDTNIETNLVQVNISCLKMTTNKYYNRSTQEIHTCKIKKVNFKYIRWPQ